MRVQMHVACMHACVCVCVCVCVCMCVCVCVCVCVCISVECACVCPLPSVHCSSRTGMESFDGQGSGGNAYGTFWEPPHGWVNSQDGGRGHTFMASFSFCTLSLCATHQIVGAHRLDQRRACLAAAWQQLLSLGSPRSKRQDICRLGTAV